jgi:hypothetical protein
VSRFNSNQSATFCRSKSQTRLQEELENQLSLESQSLNRKQTHLKPGAEPINRPRPSKGTLKQQQI